MLHYEFEKGIEARYRGELGIQQSVTLKRGRMCSFDLQGADLSGHLSPERQVKIPLGGRSSEKTVLIKK